MKSESGLYIIRPDGYDDGMASVVTACTAGTNVDLGRKNVDKFALAFVAPL